MECVVVSRGIRLLGGAQEGHFHLRLFSGELMKMALWKIPSKVLRAMFTPLSTAQIASLRFMNAQSLISEAEEPSPLMRMPVEFWL